MPLLGMPPKPAWTGRRPVYDLTGRRFGHLVVRERIARVDQSAWLCDCDCGQKRIASLTELRAKRRTDCGCEQAARRALAARRRKATALLRRPPGLRRAAPYPLWPDLLRATRFLTHQIRPASPRVAMESASATHVRDALRHHGIRVADGPCRALGYPSSASAVLWHDGTDWQWGQCVAATLRISALSPAHRSARQRRHRIFPKRYDYRVPLVVPTAVRPVVWFVVFPAGGFLVLPDALLPSRWRIFQIGRYDHRWWRWWDRVDVLQSWPYLPDDLVDP